MIEITTNTPFQYIAISILASFYAIYIGKMIMQRKRGIQTDQMAKGKKSKELFWTELILKIATYSVVIIQTISIFINTTHPYISVKIAGVVVGIIGVVIFGITVYTMRDNWRAGILENLKTDLVTSGIFRFSRNPAFLGFDLIYLSILLLFFNWTLLLFSLWATTMLHLQIKQEEKHLQLAFGEEYLKYKKHTKRYMGRKLKTRYNNGA